ncbi:hypothetical protein KNP414_05482 [Paenibacillus mucilaginosus KNP414]|uniref:Uncharacterized protein n=1 Tax=Paenibacillus mucilaginosus (strain KNP414) TaxID=1036673 RepID=F8FIA3_PAEMK|nr:hypothetical protein KNP414_05482 [Paenibacillus mucilaginosus KNP414]
MVLPENGFLAFPKGELLQVSVKVWVYQIKKNLGETVFMRAFFYDSM